MKNLSFVIHSNSKIIYDYLFSLDQIAREKYEQNIIEDTIEEMCRDYEVYSGEYQEELEILEVYSKEDIERMHNAVIETVYDHSADLTKEETDKLVEEVDEFFDLVREEQEELKAFVEQHTKYRVVVTTLDNPRETKITVIDDKLQLCDVRTRHAHDDFIVDENIDIEDRLDVVQNNTIFRAAKLEDIKKIFDAAFDVVNDAILYKYVEQCLEELEEDVTFDAFVEYVADSIVDLLYNTEHEYLRYYDLYSKILDKEFLLDLWREDLEKFYNK